MFLKISGSFLLLNYVNDTVPSSYNFTLTLTICLMYNASFPLDCKLDEDSVCFLTIQSTSAILLNLCRLSKYFC